MATNQTAHGVLMCVAILIWFPLGVFLLRLLKTKHTVLWHAIWQSIGLAMLLLGFGLGRNLSENAHQSNELHVILGTVIVVLFILMPIIGWWHHRHFVTKGTKDFKSPLHIWGGRLLLLLGLINGITGLQLSKNKSSAYIVYGVVSAVFLVAYIGIVYLKNRKVEAVVDETELHVNPQQK